MEAPKLHDAVIEIDGEGTLHGDDAVLAQLKNQQFRVRQQGRSYTLEPAHRRISEIEDPEERARAFDEFVKRVARPTGVSWPADYNVRDDIYD